MVTIRTVMIILYNDNGYNNSNNTNNGYNNTI